MLVASQPGTMSLLLLLLLRNMGLTNGSEMIAIVAELEMLALADEHSEFAPVCVASQAALPVALVALQQESETLKPIGRPVRGRVAADAGVYSSERYQEEKAEGLRHENGVARLKKLRPIHRQVVNLAVEGFSASEISRTLGKSYHMVYQTLQDPLANQEIEIALVASRHQLQALQVRGVEVVGAAMRSELPETALKGVDRLMKMQELVGIHREGKETAEDVAQKILAAVQVNVNVNGERVVQIDATHE